MTRLFKILALLSLRFASFVHCRRIFGAEQDYSKVEVRTQSLGNNVHMLDGTGGNLGRQYHRRSWPGRIIISDTASRRFNEGEGGTPRSARCRSAMPSIRHLPWRSHRGQRCLRQGRAVLVAHDNARRRMQVAGRATIALPSLTYADHMTLTLDGQTAELYHPASAHTDTDTFNLLPRSHVLATGDCFTTIGYPFIDVAKAAASTAIIVFADALIAASNSGTIIVPAMANCANAPISFPIANADRRARPRRQIDRRRQNQEQAIAAKPLCRSRRQMGRQAQQCRSLRHQYLSIAQRFVMRRAPAKAGILFFGSGARVLLLAICLAACSRGDQANADFIRTRRPFVVRLWARAAAWISSHAPWRAICPNICPAIPSSSSKNRPVLPAHPPPTMSMRLAPGRNRGCSHRTFALLLPLLDPKNATVDPRKLQWMPSAADGVIGRLRCRSRAHPHPRRHAQNPAQSGCCEFHGASRFLRRS